MTKKEIYAAIAIQANSFPVVASQGFGGESARNLYNNIVNIVAKDRASSGESRKFGKILPIILALTLLPLAIGLIYVAIVFGFGTQEDYRNFVIFPTLITAIALILVVVIAALVRIRFVKKINSLLTSGQKITAKVVDISERKKYAATTIHDGGPLMLQILYEYQNAHGKIMRIKIKLPLSDQENFWIDKEFDIIASDDNTINLILKN